MRAFYYPINPYTKVLTPHQDSCYSIEVAAKEKKAMLRTENKNTYIDQRVAILIPQFEALAPYKLKQRENGVGDLPGWKTLASKEAALLKATYPDYSDAPTYGTCLRQITALKKALLKASKNVSDPANVSPVQTIIKHFGNALNFLFSEYKYLQNIEYRTKVEERSTKENRVEIDLTPFLNIALDTLSKAASDELKSSEWKDVSCAIALVTGRRMAEIHLSGEFTKAGEYSVNFKGQLKGKNSGFYQDGNDWKRCSKPDYLKLKSVKPNLGKFVELRDHSFEIPTLVPAELVVAGVEWLEANGKRIDSREEPEAVNRKYGRYLSERVNQIWLILPSDEMTYHKFRGAYLRACVVNSGVSQYDYANFAKEILGDDDLSTIEAYQRFEVSEDSLTKV